MQPSAQPEARQITPLLKDFGGLWQANDVARKTGQYTKRRAILLAMFAGLYFDAQNQLRKVAAHDPFDRLLDFANSGITKPF